MNPPPQIFGGYSEHGMPMPQLPPDLMAAQMFGDHGLLEDTNEAKRRRIARVSQWELGQTSWMCEADLALPLGMRHVQEEEDQVRRQAAGMHALHQLQDGLRLYASRKEEESSQGVGLALRHALAQLSFSDMLADKCGLGPSISKGSRIAWVVWNTC